MWSCGVRHLRLAREAGVQVLPKHHLLVHMLLKTRLYGSPKYYATLLDESLNRQLASRARSTYAAAWERRIFWSMDLIMALGYGLRVRRGL